MMVDRLAGARFVLPLLLFALLLGCNTAVPDAPPTPIVPLPEAVHITNDAGETIATQPGLLWVLVSGVDEHGLIAEHELNLMAAPILEADVERLVHTGTAVAVQEIRQTGPQNLRRFYRVMTIEGDSGWISDYYVRRVGYLFNENGTDVPIFAAPEGSEVSRLPNVSPVTIKDPTRPDWWIVQTMAGDLTGWVPVSFVKESPEPEFLLNIEHEHE